MRFCHACGQRLEGADRFCPSCGAQQLTPDGEATGPAPGAGPGSGPMPMSGPGSGPMPMTGPVDPSPYEPPVPGHPSPQGSPGQPDHAVPPAAATVPHPAAGQAPTASPAPGYPPAAPTGPMPTYPSGADQANQQPSPPGTGLPNQQPYPPGAGQPYPPGAAGQPYPAAPGHPPQYQTPYPPTSAPAYPAPPHPGPGQPYAPAPPSTYPPAQPAPGAGQPPPLALTQLFTGPVIRDIVAAVLLITALVTTWDYSGTGGDDTWVLLSALLAFVGIGATYVLQPSVIGRTVPAEQVGLLRIGTVVPLLLVILVTLVRGLTQDRGIGLAVALAAAAVVLVAQHDTSTQGRGVLPWAAISGALYLGVGAWVVLSILIEAREVLGSLWGWAFILPILAMGLLFGIVGFRVLRRVASEWAGGLIFAALLLVAFLIVTDSMSGAGSWASRADANPIVGGLMTPMLMAAAASVGPGVYRSLQPAMQGETRWVQAVVGILGLAGILGGASVLQLLLLLIEMSRAGGSASNAQGIIALILMLSTVAMLWICRHWLLVDPVAGRRLTIWAMVILSLLALVLYAATDTRLDAYLLVLSFLMPISVVGLLTIPADVRRAYGPILPAPAAQPKPIP